MIYKNEAVLNINKIIEETQSEGPGKRFCIWVQGCSRHCKGCFAADTWDFKPKNLYTSESLISMINEQKNIEGVTILGGEPLEQPEAVAELVKGVHELGLTVLLFTGYRYDELTESDNVYWHKILQNTDVLIDGEFIEDEKCFDIPLIGSKNQTIRFLTDKYSMNDFKKNKIEIRIKKTGEVHCNGMGDFDHIRNIFKEQL